MSLSVYHILLWSGMRVELGATSGQPTRQKLLLTRVRPQSISGYASLMACHWPTEAACGLGLVSPFQLALPSTQKK